MGPTRMEATLQEDEQVQKHFRLISSVVGIGMITAVAFLLYTQDFTAFDNGRQPPGPGLPVTQE